MKTAARLMAFAMLVGATAFAGNFITEFSITTIDGKKIEYKPGDSPLVINVGSHW